MEKLILKFILEKQIQKNSQESTGKKTMGGILVSQNYYKKLPKTRWLKTKQQKFIISQFWRTED